MNLSKRDWGLLAIIVAIPLLLGYIIGQGVGGYFAEKPYRTERSMMAKFIYDKKNEHALACPLVAWLKDEPVDEAWLADCRNADKAAK